ncbi:MAG: energy transducer TonB [Pseudomonadota bacterium]|nr:energy transducer TonB [Pseudomonadota bacterium]
MNDTTHSDHDQTDRAAAPMLWLLLLVAVAAFAWWYFANRNAATQAAGPDLALIEGGAEEVAAGDERDATGTTAAERNNAPGKAVARTAPTSSQPQLLSAALPRYPAAERQRGVEGNVTLRIDVGANGVPVDVAYAHRSGNRALDRAAMTAAHDWRFQPAMRNGEPVASTVNVPVAFRL